jgi:hypothetical protein
MDAASQPTLNQLIFLCNEESRAKANLERALECYGEQLPLDDPYDVNPRKPHISEVLNIFRAFISEMCEIRRRTLDVNEAAKYVYTAVMKFCRTTRSGVAIHQLPDDPAFRNQIQVAIEEQLGTLRTDAAQTAQCVVNGADRNGDLAFGVERPKARNREAAPAITLDVSVEAPTRREQKSDKQSNPIQPPSRPEEPEPAVTELNGEARLSPRDRRIHDSLGESNFRNLTNTEISRDKHLRNVLRTFELKPGTDATKACLDRIRRGKGYPLSREISKKRSSRM